MAKTALLNLRIDPGVKEALRIVAVQQHRSLSNTVEYLVFRYCKENDIPIKNVQSVEALDNS